MKTNKSAIQLHPIRKNLIFTVISNIWLKSRSKKAKYHAKPKTGKAGMAKP
jgi:hypothetical protein